MKQNQKLSDIFGGLAVFAVFAGCVEALDGGLTSWTLICLAAAFCFGVLSKKTQSAE